MILMLIILSGLSANPMWDRHSQSHMTPAIGWGFLSQSKEIGKIKVHLIKHQLPWSSSLFYSALLEFTHEDFTYFLSLRNALNVDKINKKPWEFALDVARCIRFLE